MPMITFLVYISMNWWATWYPGAEPGGGGYIAQRMFSAKDEKHSLLATLWFNIAHFAIRPWPWILVALASLVLFPGLQDPESGYVRVMIAYLPDQLTDGSVWMLPIYNYTGVVNNTDGSSYTGTWSTIAVDPAYVQVPNSSSGGINPGGPNIY
jgi:hypothetical protein